MERFINTGQDLIDSIDLFVGYLESPSTQQRIIKIDKELGSNYLKSIADFIYAYRHNKLNISLHEDGISSSM